jgi:hypothetical protein
MAKFVPPAIRTRDELKAHIDAGMAEQNGHGYDDLVKWITEAKKYHEPPTVAKWARRFNRDWRTMRNWVDIYNRGL